MDSKINKEVVELFFNKLSKIFKYFFPGIFILEIFFNQGIFSNPPTTFITLFIYVFWCGIFSIPYHSNLPYSIDTFMDNFIEILCTRLKIDKEKLSEGYNSSMEEWENNKDGIELGFILVEMTLTYFVFKILIWFNLPNYEYLYIPINVLQFFITLTTVIILSYPISYIYSIIYREMLFLQFKKWFKTRSGDKN